MGKAADDPSALGAAATLAAEAARAVADANGSVEYKENLVRVLVERCFRSAVADCTPCVYYVETYQLTIRLTRQLPAAEPPPALLERLKAAAEQGRSE